MLIDFSTNEIITSEKWFHSIDDIKLNNTVTITNNYLSIIHTKEIFEKKCCFYYRTDDVCLALIPYHSIYYDIIFLADSAQSLIYSIKKLINKLETKEKIRLSVIGKLNEVKKLSTELSNNGFPIIKKLARVHYISNIDNNAKDLIIDKNNCIDNEDYIKLNIDVHFAAISDADEILEELINNFDLLSENVPEIDEIKNNIESNNVIIAKKDNKIIALQYFFIKNGIRYGVYELVNKNYRKHSLIFYLNKFADNYLKMRNVHVSRVIGWRDLDNKRLIKAYHALGERFDGVYIYNHAYN